MKRIITMALASVFVLSLFSTNVNAQGKKMPEVMNKVKDRIDPASIAGLHNYEADEMLKILKIRRADKKGQVSSLFNTYNSDLNVLRDDNMELIVGLGITVKDIIKEKDFKALWSSRSDYKDRVRNVKEEHMAIHTSLQTELSEILTKRQRRKWVNHQQKLRKIDGETFDMGDLFSFVGM